MFSKFLTLKKCSLSFEESSKSFSPLYISFFFNSVFYTSFSIGLKSILCMYFALDFYMYVFVIDSNITYIFCFYLIHYLNHKK
jgi:hypothetical protein